MPQYWNYWNKFVSIFNQIEQIKDIEEKKKAYNEFAQNLINDFSTDTNNLAQRLIEIDSDIDVVGVPLNLIESLKEALFCYINGQFLSAIAAAGITAELFCVHIYHENLVNIGLDRLQIKRRMESFKNIPQSEKIDTLHAIVGIPENICAVLHEIRKRRNYSVHPNEGYNYKVHALDCLQNIIDILNLYSNWKKSFIENNKEILENKNENKQV